MARFDGLLKAEGLRSLSSCPPVLLILGADCPFFNCLSLPVACCCLRPQKNGSRREQEERREDGETGRQINCPEAPGLHHLTVAAAAAVAPDNANHDKN